MTKEKTFLTQAKDEVESALSGVNKILRLATATNDPHLKELYAIRDSLKELSEGHYGFHYVLHKMEEDIPEAELTLPDPDPERAHKIISELYEEAFPKEINLSNIYTHDTEDTEFPPPETS